MNVGASAPGERGRNIGDGGTSKEPNELSEEVGEGVESFDASDFESPSDAEDLSDGTMSRSHSSSSWDGHLRREDSRRKTLWGEERWGELTSVGGIGVASGCRGRARRGDRFLAGWSRESEFCMTTEKDMEVRRKEKMRRIAEDIEGGGSGINPSSSVQLTNL